MLKLVGMVSNDNYSYLVFLNTFLSLTCGHVKIGMYDKERLLISRHSLLNTLLSLASVHFEMGRYGSETPINHTLHIEIQFYSYSLELLKLEGIVWNAY